ncbi:MAG: Hsp20/alpha crystallin family protein, partial [Sphingobacteriales bacterium]
MSSLVKSNGFPTFGTMLEDFWNTDKFFGTPFFRKETLPAVNVKDHENTFELEVAAPGFKKEDFKITTEGGL